MKPGQSLLKNSFEDVFDNAISSGSNGWTVYGSKKPLNQPYRITNLYNIKYNSEEGEDFNSAIEINPVDIESFDVNKNFQNVCTIY